ncbi:metal ABC transporter solute-binding protein, Zn/Mn family, partial [Alistipes senegalensis]
MRKIATYLSAIVLLTACITNNRQNNRILYVSIQPLQSLVDSIVGGDFEVEVLVPAGASPETFEPTPRQFVELNEAQLIFNVGLID